MVGFRRYKAEGTRHFDERTTFGSVRWEWYVAIPEERDRQILTIISLLLRCLTRFSLADERDIKLSLLFFTASVYRSSHQISKGEAFWIWGRMCQNKIGLARVLFPPQNNAGEPLSPAHSSMFHRPNKIQIEGISQDSYIYIFTFL